MQALAQTRILEDHQLQATAATQHLDLGKAHARVPLRLLLILLLPHLWAQIQALQTPRDQAVLLPMGQEAELLAVLEVLRPIDLVVQALTGQEAQDPVGLAVLALADQEVPIPTDLVALLEVMHLAGLVHQPLVRLINLEAQHLVDLKVGAEQVLAIQEADQEADLPTEVEAAVGVEVEAGVLSRVEMQAEVAVLKVEVEVEVVVGAAEVEAVAEVDHQLSQVF